MAAFLQLQAPVPELPQRHRHAEREARIVFDGPVQRRARVVVLQFEPFRPERHARSVQGIRRSALRKLGDVGGELPIPLLRFTRVHTLLCRTPRTIVGRIPAYHQYGRSTARIERRGNPPPRGPLRSE
jgi:hypothetical protein